MLRETHKYVSTMKLSSLKFTVRAIESQIFLFYMYLDFGG